MASSAVARRTTTSVAPRRRRSSGGRRKQSSGKNPVKARERERVRTMSLGGLTSFLFGYMQGKLDLPSLPNIPDSLTYGTLGIAAGLLGKSDTVIKCATGPFFAGLHNIALHGFSDTVGYDGGDPFETAGEFDETAGVFDDDVTAGDFDDL